MNPLPKMPLNLVIIEHKVNTKIFSHAFFLVGQCLGLREKSEI